MSDQLIYCAICGAANSVHDPCCFACKEPLEAARTGTSRESLLQGRYRLLKQLGTGGFGEVYRAEDCEQPDLPLAIKSINLHNLSTRQIIEATETFSRERALLAKLNHASLPRLHATFEDAEHWYLVIDYFPGETLESRLNARRRALPSAEPERAWVKEVLRCGLSLCEVLNYLHTRTPPVIFRDLKPSNIICVSQKKYALIDFGIARTFKPGQEKDTLPLGSPGYAAPEQYGKAQTDARADIYSLGAILHQMLTGIDPSDEPFSFAMPGYTDLALCRLESLLLNMVALKREERPDSASQVAQELRAIEEVHEGTDTRIWIPQPGQTPPALAAIDGNGAGQFQLQIQHPLTPRQRQKQAKRQARAGKRPVSRRKLLVGGALASGLLLSGGLLTNWLIQTRRGPRVTWSSTVTDLTEIRQVAWSPDGRYLMTSGSDEYGAAFALFWDLHKEHYIALHAWSYNPGSQAAAWYPGNSKPQTNYYLPDDTIALIDSIQISEDQKLPGQRLILEHMSGEEAGLQQVSSIIPGLNYPIEALQWSPDGMFLAIASSPDILIWNPAINGVAVTCHGYAQEVSTGEIILLQWSPDSRYVASVLTRPQVKNNPSPTQMSGYPVHIWSARTGKQVTMCPAQQNATTFLQWSPDSRYLAYGNTTGFINFYDLYSEENFAPISSGLITVPSYVPSGLSASLPLMAWEPQGTRFLTFFNDESGDGSVQLWENVSDLEEMPFEQNELTIGQQTIIGVSWSPDGRFMLVICVSEKPYLGKYTYTVGFYDASTRSLQYTITFPQPLQGLAWMPDGHSLLLWGKDPAQGEMLLQVYAV